MTRVHVHDDPHSRGPGRPDGGQGRLEKALHGGSRAAPDEDVPALGVLDPGNRLGRRAQKLDPHAAADPRQRMLERVRFLDDAFFPGAPDLDLHEMTEGWVVEVLT